MLNQMVEYTSQPWGGEARQPTRVCVVCGIWYSICQCAKQVGFEKQQRKRESIRRIAVCSAVPSLCSRETQPWR